MSLSHLTLGERMVLAARLMTVEHVRQEADAAGIDLAKLSSASAELERVSHSTSSATTLPPRPQLARRVGEPVRVTVSTRESAGPVAVRQDLFRQPAVAGFGAAWPHDDGDDRRAA